MNVKTINFLSKNVKKFIPCSQLISNIKDIRYEINLKPYYGAKAILT
jgi:hypothetical protein